MWDLQTGKLLRSIPDAHPQGSAVLHVVVRWKGVAFIHDSLLYTATNEVKSVSAPIYFLVQSLKAHLCFCLNCGS